MAAGSLPHAPGQVSDGADITTFAYDANGNRASRVTGGQTMSYTYDEESRLTQVLSNTGSSALTTTFVYDGDGQRVMRTASDGQKATYVGSHYEIPRTYQWGENIPPFGDAGNVQVRPDMVSGVDGSLYLVWVEDADQIGSFIYFAIRNPQTGEWDVVENVGTADWHADPAVTVDPAGNVTVAWETYVGPTSGLDVRVCRRGAGGGWSCDGTIASSSYDETHPTLAAAPDGSVYLAWQVNAPFAFVKVARWTASGGWDPPQEVYGSVGYVTPALTSDSAGKHLPGLRG